MKAAILFPFHSLCFLTLLVFNTLQPPVATAEQEIPEPVYDYHGKPVRPGQTYYVSPLSDDNGGLALGSIRTNTCPLYVIRDPSSIGTPMFFNLSQQPGEGESPLDYIPTFTDITVTGFEIGTCEEYSKVWKIYPGGTSPSLFFVSTDGYAGTTPTLFKIEKPEGCEHPCHIYNFRFCPSNLPYQPICGTLGTYVDDDRTKVFAFGDGIDPFYVRFQKISINHPRTKINQGGLSIV